MKIEDNSNITSLNLDGLYPTNNDTYDSLYKESNETTTSSDIKSEDQQYIIKNDIRKLWNKKDYFYQLDQISRDKILEDFENKIKNKDIVVEDAFYRRLSTICSSDINLLKEDTYIKKRLECKKLRELNFKFLDLCNKNYREIEDFILKYRSCTDKDEKIILKGIIKQKKRIDFLYNKVRNYISELIIRGEDCYIFMDSVWSAVFRKSLELATTEVSSQEM